MPYKEEPEGITYWDLDATDAPATSGVTSLGVPLGGQIHALLLDNDLDADDVYVKHYRASASCELPATITVSPQALDFGDVGMGGKKTAAIALTNRSPVDLLVTNVTLQADTDPQFSLNAVPPVPLTLTPGATASIEVTYAPMVAGHAGGELDITGDVANGTVTVILGGYGISLADQAEALLASLDEEVAGGQLGGSGAGSSATERFTAFRNMLVDALALIEANRIDRACRQLRDALALTDSLSPPQDFVVGPGAARIAGRIRSLMSNLGCE